MPDHRPTLAVWPVSPAAVTVAGRGDEFEGLLVQAELARHLKPRAASGKKCEGMRCSTNSRRRACGTRGMLTTRRAACRDHHMALDAVPLMATFRYRSEHSHEASRLAAGDRRKNTQARTCGHSRLDADWTFSGSK